MKSRAPQLHLEYRFYKQLGQSGRWHSVMMCLWYAEQFEHEVESGLTQQSSCYLGAVDTMYDAIVVSGCFHMLLFLLVCWKRALFGAIWDTGGSTCMSMVMSVMAFSLGQVPMIWAILSRPLDRTPTYQSPSPMCSLHQDVQLPGLMVTSSSKKLSPQGTLRPPDLRKMSSRTMRVEVTWPWHVNGSAVSLTLSGT